MMMDFIKEKTALLIALFFILLPQICFAADAPASNSLDYMIGIYRDSTQVWEPIIHDLTMGLFWGLVTISFAWSSCQLLLKGGGLVDVVADLTTRVMTVGVAVWLINSAPHLGRVLISSFTEIGKRLSPETVAFSPSNVVEMAINIMLMVIQKSSTWSPILSLMLCLSAIIILICFALIALEMTTLIISSYITVSGGVVMMGFLGSEWTKDNAMNYFTAVLGVAVKMFVMQLILILGFGFIKDWSLSMTPASKDIEYLGLLVVSIVFYGLIREIPQIAASLASGRFTAASGGLQAAVAGTAGLMAGAALAATGVGAAVMGAMSASETKDNEDAILKHTLNTGGDASSPEVGGGGSPSAPPSADTGAAASADRDPAKHGPTPSPAQDAKDSSTPSNWQKAGQIGKGVGKASVSVAKSAALAGLKHVAAQSTIGNILAKSGIEIGQLGSSQEKHDALMKGLNIKPPTPPVKDDGNDMNNNRTTLEEDDERHSKQRGKRDS